MDSPRGPERKKFGQRLQARLERLVGRRLFWGLFVAVLFALPITRSLARTLPPAPAVLGEVEPFELSDQYGHVTGTEQLKNHLWVVTHLGTATSAAQTAQIEVVRNVIHRARNLGDAFRMVTVAEDAGRDDEGARRALVEKYCSSAKLWTYLGGTGPALNRANRELVATLGVIPDDALMLVDARGQIRGVYLTDKPSIDRLMQDMSFIANLP